MDKILITGCAGFIGYHLASKCIDNNKIVLGMDSLNTYYDVSLKEARLARLINRDNFEFLKLNLAEHKETLDIVKDYKPDVIIHLAAQAGVRYSLENPLAYIESNLQGFTSIIDAARHSRVKHFIYASSSSVYGANTKQPFKETQSLSHPLSLYAATKKSNELIAHSYSNLYELPTTGLRFFTVYGPWGRPDMALYLFTKNIIENKLIEVFNNGQLVRDFTYVDDIVNALYRLLPCVPLSNSDWLSDDPDPSTSFAPYRVFNIGNSNPTPLMDYIKAIEEALGKKAMINYLPMQPGDVPSTYADTNALYDMIQYRPGTKVSDGVKEFVAWYLDYYRVEQGVSYA